MTKEYENKLKEYENKLKDIENSLIQIYGKDIDDLMQDMKESAGFKETKLESKLYFDKDKNTITIRVNIGEEDQILNNLKRLGVQFK